LEKFPIFFYIEKIEKENLVTRVEFLGKGYQLKWPLGTDWELQERIGSVNENHCWEHNGNMVPSVTGTLKSHLAQNKINAHRLLPNASGYQVMMGQLLEMAPRSWRFAGRFLKSQRAGLDMLHAVFGSEHRFQ